MTISYTDETKVALIDEETGTAFGPTFGDIADAEDFVTYAAEQGTGDLHALSALELDKIYQSWLIEVESSNSDSSTTVSSVETGSSSGSSSESGSESSQESETSKV